MIRMLLVVLAFVGVGVGVGVGGGAAIPQFRGGDHFDVLD